MEQGRSERAWQLVRAHLDGDRDAFVVLVTEYTPLLRYFCRGRENAQDVIDETWYQVLRRIEEDHVGWHRRFSSWIGGLCRNITRSKALRAEASNLDVETERAPASEPIELVAMAELHAALAACLDAIDDRLRLAYELHYREEMSLVHVAAELGCSEANVRQKLIPRLHCAVRRCLARKGFRDWGSIPEAAGTSPHG